MTIFRNDLFKWLKQYIFIKFKNIPVFYCYGALVNPKTNKLSSKSHPIAISFIFMRHFIYLFVIFVSSFWKALIKHILNGIFLFHCNIFILDFLKRKLDIRKGFWDALQNSNPFFFLPTWFVFEREFNGRANSMGL